jgi:cytochrome c oxidase assembly protein subunit 15
LARLKWITLAGILLAVVVVVLGAFTRLVDAGLGCPDWPGCYGHLTWPDEAHEIAAAERIFPETPVDLDKTWPEMVHRYFAGSLLLLVLGLTVYCWRHRPANHIRELASVLLVLIICQAAFGMWTVTLQLWPQVVTAHLLGGFATLSMLWLIYLRLGGFSALQIRTQSVAVIKPHARLAFAVVIAQIALGGWVSSNYAALACADFPTCYGSYWPPMDVSAGFDILQSVGPNYLGGLLESEARVAIHWFHRLGALVVLVVVGSLCWRLKKHNALLGGLLAGVLGLQVLLGIGNIVWTLPLAVATAHNAVGALLLLMTVAVNFAPARKPARDSINQTSMLRSTV